MTENTEMSADVLAAIGKNQTGDRPPFSWKTRWNNRRLPPKVRYWKESMEVLSSADNMPEAITLM